MDKSKKKYGYEDKRLNTSSDRWPRISTKRLSIGVCPSKQKVGRSFDNTYSVSTQPRVSLKGVELSEILFFYQSCLCTPYGYTTNYMYFIKNYERVQRKSRE